MYKFGTCDACGEEVNVVSRTVYDINYDGSTSSYKSERVDYHYGDCKLGGDLCSGFDSEPSEVFTCCVEENAGCHACADCPRNR